MYFSIHSTHPDKEYLTLAALRYFNTYCPVTYVIIYIYNITGRLPGIWYLGMPVSVFFVLTDNGHIKNFTIVLCRNCVEWTASTIALAPTTSIEFFGTSSFAATSLKLAVFYAVRYRYVKTI